MRKMVEERILFFRELGWIHYIHCDINPHEVNIRQDLVIYDEKNPDMPDVTDININDFFNLVEGEFNIEITPAEREKLITLEDLISFIVKELESTFAWYDSHKDDEYYSSEDDDDYDLICDLIDDDD